MGVDLRNDAGETIKLTNRHWAVMLTLAETFGWLRRDAGPGQGRCRAA